MSSAYLKIRNIRSLQTVLDYIKSVKDKSDLIVFIDIDDTFINSDNNTIIEPKVTKELFDYMLKNKIYFSIITGRFHDTACDDNKRNLTDMYNNIIYTIYPTLVKLGLDVSEYLTEEVRRTVYKIFNDKEECVGILYMGIFFTGRKGETIKNFIEKNNLPYKNILFIDDYEPYLIEATTSYPKIKAYRRMIPYTPKF